MTTQAVRSTQCLVKYVVMLCIAFIALFPIAWMCIISLKTPTENISGFNSLFVLHPTLRNYMQLFKQIPIGKNFFNSIFTTALGTVTTVYFCALAGFAFAKYRFPGRDVLFYFVIATMLIPPEVGAVPQFLIMRRLHLINSLWSLIVPKIATAVGIFYMRQYILDVPDELLEAARIDGCKDFGIFNKIMFPVIVPALISWASLTIVARWNDFFLADAFFAQSGKIYVDDFDFAFACQRRSFYSVAGDPCRYDRRYHSDYSRVFDFSNDAKIRFSFGSRKRISISRRYILRYPLIRSIRCVHDNCRFGNIV